MGKYWEDDEALNMGIDQELALALPSPMINEHIGGISETMTISEYTIPVKFDSIQCLIDHWDTCIDLNEKNHKSQWRTYFKWSQQKNFSRMKIVVAIITIGIKAGEKSDVISELETLYSTNNSSLANLTDTVKKHKNWFLNQYGVLSKVMDGMTTWLYVA